MRAEATRWLVVAAIVAGVAAALVGIFALTNDTLARAATGFPIALLAAVAIRELGPDLKPTHRHDRVATAVELAVFGVCTVAGIVATDFATSADDAARYIGYFITLVVAKYVGAIGARGANARGANGR